MANIRKSFNFRNGVQVDNDNFVVNPNGLVGIGTSTPSEYFLNVYGDKGLRVTGLTTVNNVYVSGGLEVAGVTTVGFITANNAHISGILTVTEIDLGSGGLSSLVGYAITDAWVAPDSVGLVTTRRIGIGTDVTPNQQLGVVGDVNITGVTTSNSLSVTNVATAATFSGSGALLTDIPNSATTATHFNNNSTIVARDSSGNFNAGIITATFSGTATLAENLTGSPAITVSSVNSTTKVTTPSIGVGTDSPSADIHIRNSGISSVQLTSDASYSTLTLGKSVPPSSNNGEIRYGYNNLIGSYPYSTSQSLDIINYGADNLNFYLNPSGLGTAFNWLTNASNRAMVLTQSGNLGINSTLPTEKLTVGGGATITGNLSVDGNITGSGANLTNLPAGELTGSLPAIDGSNLLNLTTVGSGINIEDNGSSVGAAVTIINFDSGLNVVASTGIVTVTSSAGSVGSALTDTSVAHNSIGIGSESLSSETPDGVGNGEKNTALGYNAGKSTTSANSNNYFGYEAGYNTNTGGGNLYFGKQSGYHNTLGFSNIGIGNSALAGSNNNQNCIGIGYRSGGHAKNSSANQNNVTIGYLAGQNLSGGDENVIIGANSGLLLTNGTNNIIIGEGAEASSPSVYNEITLGGTGITSFRIPGLQSSASNGQVLTYSSSTDSIGFQTGAYGSRTEVSGSTGSIGAGNTATITITGAKAYSLLKVGISSAAWVRLYTDTTSRTNDSSRTSTTDPLPGSGVLAEVITTTSGISTFKMSPGVIGWNDDSTPSTNIYATVTNNETSSANINVTLTIVTLEA